MAASIAIYFSQDYTLENFEQSKARCYRKGSEIHKKITYYYLVYKKTIDEIIYEALKSKHNIAETLMSNSVWVNLNR